MVWSSCKSVSRCFGTTDLCCSGEVIGLAKPLPILRPLLFKNLDFAEDDAILLSALLCLARNSKFNTAPNPVLACGKIDASCCCANSAVVAADLSRLRSSTNCCFCFVSSLFLSLSLLVAGAVYNRVVLGSTLLSLTKSFKNLSAMAWFF